MESEIIKRKKIEEKKSTEDYIKKEISRGRTWVLINRGTILKIKKCRICGSKENLEIHHDVYPTKDTEIIKAVKEGKIYFLCKDHHLEKTVEQKIRKPKMDFMSLKLKPETIHKFKQAKRLREFKDEMSLTISEFFEILLEKEFKRYDDLTITKVE